MSEQPDAAAEGEAPPETGDIVIDSALGDLAAVPEDDLDGRLAAGEEVQRTLRSRLGDLGG
ncbi:hypothetical protein [Phycicoccus sonneratiae]|uniref:Uncharacterized protein n=1 Tax=Phycicoccus sonneratiae TaxID=2807628 RepID=A0ABS2CHP3_9MICO|nr:hypothetical protein [Phycicoccus sonneraticus]MBM6399389.1 hypothetical protein [Phycicoccus sonneraticus]